MADDALIVTGGVEGTEGEPAGDAGPGSGIEYWFEEGCFITELMNSPDDPALSIARARVPSGGRTRWHRLHGITERYLVTQGTGRVEVGGQPPREVGPGALVTIAPRCPQRIANLGQDDLVFLALCTPRFLREAYEDIEERMENGDGGIADKDVTA